jgi:hypothetical protein
MLHLHSCLDGLDSERFSLLPGLLTQDTIATVRISFFVYVDGACYSKDNLRFFVELLLCPGGIDFDLPWASPVPIK